MPATVEYYAEVVAAFPDTESLTVLTVAGATRDQVAAQLDVDLLEPVEEDAWADGDRSAWALLEIPGGVVAVELSGFGDPSNHDLVALSRTGAAAVVRSNILAHYRFGCARDGELSFDDDEYIFVRDPSAFPPELRDLFDLAHVDLTGDDGGGDDEGLDPLTVGLAMSERVTGVQLTPAHVTAVLGSDFFAAPAARYPSAGSTTTSDKDDQFFRGENPLTLAVTEDAYLIGGAFPGTFDNPPAPWPDDAFFVATYPDVAWVRKLSTRPETSVLLTVVVEESEPTEVLQQASEAYHHQASVVLISEQTSPGGVWTIQYDALRVYDCFSFDVKTFLIEHSGIYQLRLFANLPDVDHDDEHHLLVVWPDPDAQPDIRGE